MLPENEVKLDATNTSETSENISNEPKVHSISDESGVVTEKPPVKKVKKSIMANRYFLAVVIVVLVISGIGSYVYKHNKSLKEQEKLVQEQQAKIDTARKEAEAKKLIEEQKQKEEDQKIAKEISTLRQDVKISVLNGTSINGLAGSTAKTLEEVGYVDVKAGNSPTKSHTTTTVSYQEDLSEAVVQDIKNVLEKTFSSVETEVFATDKKGDYNAVVTTGSLLKTNKQ